MQLFQVSPHGYILETSTLDPSAPSLTMTTRNITHTGIMTVVESQLIHPASAESTVVETEAEVTCTLANGGRFLRNRIEGFGVQRFDKNIKKSRGAVDWVIDNTLNPTPKLKGLAKLKERVGEKASRAAERVNERVEKMVPTEAPAGAAR